MKTFSCLLAIVFSLFLHAAEIRFEKKQIKIGSQSLLVEIADTPEKSARGLMFRQQLAEGTGMLFVFPNEETRSFWMKNTFIPLSIGYFNAKKELIDVQDMAPVTSEMQLDLPTYVSKGPAKYALEVPKGWFEKHKIKPMQKFSF
ncbi:MAG: DUF192 domain-containing protein [Pseudobdellovibrionaceae bacterium]